MIADVNNITKEKEKKQKLKRKRSNLQSEIERLRKERYRKMPKAISNP